MKLSLRRIASFVVICAMMLSVLALSAVAAKPQSKTIAVTRANGFVVATDVIIFASNIEDQTVEQRYAGDAWVEDAKVFQWFSKIYLEYDEETKMFKVIDTCPASDTDLHYRDWTLGFGKAVVMAHSECADPASLAAIESGLAVGNTLYYVGDYGAALTATGPFTATLTTDATQKDNAWVKPEQAELTPGLNIVPGRFVYIADPVAGAELLSDGEWALDASTFVGDNRLLSVHNEKGHDGDFHPEVYLIQMYEENTSVKEIKIGIYGEWYSMIGWPQAEILIETSDDGEFWFTEETVSHTLDPLEGSEELGANSDHGTEVMTLTLSEPTTAAKYVRATIKFADGPHGSWDETLGAWSGRPVWEYMFLSEVEFIADDGTDEPGTSEPETSEPGTSEPETSIPSGGQTGDASNVLVFAVLGLVAVLGSAIVIKNRK